MKSNEAPEKIFLHPDIGGREFIRPWLKIRVNQESVEYTCSDAFIEKAAKWFKENLLNHTYVYEGEVGIGIDVFLEQFKKAMKL